jgi:hypothetical protein
MRYYFLAVVTFASILNAEVLYDDKTYSGNIYGGTGCNNDFTLADVFTLDSGGGTIESIDWWLTGDGCATASSQWQISFYTEANTSPYTSPGDTLWQEYIYPEITGIAGDGGSRSQWHAVFNLDPADYLYLDGNNNYWVGITYTGPEYGVYGAYSYPGAVYAYYYPSNGQWYWMDGNLIFALNGTPGASSLDRTSWGAIKNSFQGSF